MIQNGLDALADRLLVKAGKRGPKAFFVTGTDTGVGKTWVSCALIREFQRRGIRVAALKPICCGDRGDSIRYWNLLHREFPLRAINPIYLKRPLAPAAQACPSWRDLTRRIRDAFRHWMTFPGLQVLLVEGAGGLLCPITQRHTMRDLALRLKLPLLIVARDQLGALNHSLLTLEAAEAASLDCVALVLNPRKRGNFAGGANGAVLQRWTRVPVHRV